MKFKVGDRVVLNWPEYANVKFGDKGTVTSTSFVSQILSDGHVVNQIITVKFDNRGAEVNLFDYRINLDPPEAPKEPKGPFVVMSGNDALWLCKPTLQEAKDWIERRIKEGSYQKYLICAPILASHIPEAPVQWTEIK